MSIRTKWNPYGKPTTYDRLSTKRGSGYILSRLSEESINGGLTRNDIYPDRPGFASMLWAALIEDGLIVCVNGREIETHVHCYWGGPKLTTRIASFTKDPPRYVITHKGQQILDMTRCREAFKQALA